MANLLTPQELDRFLAPFTPVAAALALRTREAILQAFPEAVETAEGKEIGYGFDRGYKGLVFTISLKKAGINLGVAFGAAMEDPAGLMQGTGKVHRHVEILTPEAIARPALKTLLQHALAARRRQLLPAPR